MRVKDHTSGEEGKVVRESREDISEVGIRDLLSPDQYGHGNLYGKGDQSL